MKKILVAAFILISVGTVYAGEKIDPAQRAYDKADGLNGGLLYDKFWKKGEVSARFTNAYGLDIERINRYSAFYRCKSCHGWDQIGRNGYYIKKAPAKAKQPTVTAVNLIKSGKTLTPAELFGKIKNPTSPRSIAYDPAGYDPELNSKIGDKMPSYGEIFTDEEIWDLVKFLKEDAVLHQEFYTLVTSGSYPKGKAVFTEIGKGGNPQNGDIIYAENCASCHGADGRKISIKGYSVGEFTRKKTYELAHKVKFGQPGSNMFGTDLTVQEMKDLHKALTDGREYPAIKGR
ncbi:MAG: c-type cytochrome [Thermodesulfobacteriota bacterium]